MVFGGLEGSLNEKDGNVEIWRNWVDYDCVECKWWECEDIDVDCCFNDENDYWNESKGKRCYFGGIEVRKKFVWVDWEWNW